MAMASAMRYDGPLITTTLALVVTLIWRGLFHAVMESTARLSRPGIRAVRLTWLVWFSPGSAHSGHIADAAG
jgi:hypothetical protein